MLDWPFDNSFATLPDRFFSRLAPTPVSNPEPIAINRALAGELGLDADGLSSDDGVRILAGNTVPKGADPLAQVYAGHQFGGWVPQLGDGRAILLGEIKDIKGIRRDLQLKGAGRTPYSRGGDGRAWIGPVIREYLVSEAMHALGIPTTRALAAVTTGESVYRDLPLPGAVLTRVASSHIRVGNFQFFAARQDLKALQALTDYVIARHYPDTEDAQALLDAVIRAQARLVAQWMGVGFIHGVMNTDNTHVAGETIDYGPCAFMDGFHPDTVYSSIDRSGRYAYARQPEIMVWNMAQFATSLLPLFDGGLEAAVERATESVRRFPDLYRAAWLDVFRAKMGLRSNEDGDVGLIEGLLKIMGERNADFTNTFRGLSDASARAQFPDPSGFDEWEERWLARRKRDPHSPEKQRELLRTVNPAVIPRNHQIENVIRAALANDFAPMFRLSDVLAAPFDLSAENAGFSRPPEPGEEVRQTFCGT